MKTIILIDYLFDFNTCDVVYSYLIDNKVCHIKFTINDLKKQNHDIDNCDKLCKQAFIQVMTDKYKKIN